MPLRPLLARMPSSHRSCSPLHSLFGAEHTAYSMKMVKEIYKSQVYCVKNKTLHEKQKHSLVRCLNGKRGRFYCLILI